MVSRSLKAKQLSRTKVDLFLECPRCFYDDVVLHHPRPSSPPFTLNNAVDALLKSEFDEYRKSGRPHPLFATAGVNAVPFAHPDLNKWRANFTGVRWLDPETGWTLFGAIDDVWQTPERHLIAVDYKATAKKDEVSADNIYPGYKRQIEVYQFLLEQQGYTVESRAWFVYANGIPTAKRFDDVLTFRTTLLPYNGNRSWVLQTFRNAVGLASGSTRPGPATGCTWCEYVASRVENT